MALRGNTKPMWKQALLALEAAVALAPGAIQASEPRSLLYPGRLQSSPSGNIGDALAVGGLLAHLDSFVESRDGTVRAILSFHNPTGSTASFLAPTTTQGDQIGTLMRSLRDPVPELVTSEGRSYRFVDLSAFGDTQTRSDWISVPPGGTAVLTATFSADGARYGQPSALSLAIRETWRPDSDAAERTSAFAVNFRGLHRPPADAAQAAPRPLVEAVAMPAPVAIGRAAEPAPAVANFNDDLTPAIAKLASAKPDDRRYLIAIGVNAYDEAPGVPFADRSARAMSDLLRKIYGIPEDNITLITGAEATGTRMSGRINSLLQRLTAGDTVFFYYAGHGLSARDGSAVYIVPKDAVPGAYEVETLSLGALLARFEASPASRVVAFLDTCFSGRVGHDQSLFPGTAPLVPVPVETNALRTTGKVTLFLAGQGNQFANDYPERGHRLFSYYMMQGILAGYGSANDLESFVAREVRRVSAKRGSDFVQEPHLEGASQVLPGRLGTPRGSARAN
jgi:hypothetical protein